MNDLPSTLTYFGSLQGINQIINNLALPLFEPCQLNDPFLTDKNTVMPFTKSDLFESSVKFISHGVLGKNTPRGQPGHPLNKAIMRWRAENRFNDEVEIREALQGLLPSLVEQTYNDARSHHQSCHDYVCATRVIPLFEKFQTLSLWENQGFGHTGAAIKFNCLEESVFTHCKSVIYQKKPVTTVDMMQFVERMTGIATEILFEPDKLLLAQNYIHRNLKEWRLVFQPEVEQLWLKFSVELIHSVYIGALVTEENVRKLYKRLTHFNPDINVFRAHCRTNEYELDFSKVGSSGGND